MAKLSEEQPLLRQELYQPLSSTEYRIVHLFPGDFADDIQCALEIRDTSVRIGYEAISYEWGDETNAKPIHVARLDAPPRGVSSLRGTRLFTRASSAYRLAVQFERNRPMSLCGFLTSSFAFLFWWILPFVKSDWLPFFIPISIFRATTCFWFALMSAVLCQTSFRLIEDIMETKIWNLWTIGWRTRKENVSLSKFETLHVTPNLENALRYLRRYKGVRILWIDALCINQKSEAETLVQVQKMGWIYANAYMVLIWLGGYHDYQNGQSCGENVLICAHQEQIELAFASLWGSHWGLSRCFRATRYAKPYEKSQAGLRHIVERGWWQRLWVIQEVALATGKVRIQCGHSMCNYDDFHTWLSDMPVMCPKGLSFEQESKHVVYFQDLIRKFRHSFKADKAFLDFNTTVFKFEDFASDLCNILLRTSGSFKCRDYEDRLYAVLGIVAGVRPMKQINPINLFFFASSISMLGNLGVLILPDPFKKISLNILIVMLGFMLFFGSKAKNWAIGRSDYIIRDSHFVLPREMGEQGHRLSRVDFFTKLAHYLAGKAKSLSFLEAASCGEDEDPTMPSWVPNWSREVDAPAWEFAYRKNIGRPLFADHDAFSFLEEGRVIDVQGYRVPVANLYPIADLGEIPLPHIMMGLKPEYEAAVALASGTEEVKIYAGAECRGPDLGMEVSIPDEVQKNLFQDIRNRASTGTIVHIHDPSLSTNGTIGFLKAGSMAMGDHLIAVPSCFHNIVLRPCGFKGDRPCRWKLVGLVEACPFGDWLFLPRWKHPQRYQIE